MRPCLSQRGLEDGRSFSVREPFFAELPTPGPLERNTYRWVARHLAVSHRPVKNGLEAREVAILHDPSRNDFQTMNFESSHVIHRHAAGIIVAEKRDKALHGVAVVLIRARLEAPASAP